jgi:hypothetical protein
MVKWLAMLTANPTNALNVTKTSRFSYAGNTIRIPEDLPEKNSIQIQTQSKEKSSKNEIQVGGWSEK